MTLKNGSQRTESLIPIGIRGLDEIFLGGIRRNNIILSEGAPGTGKTTLGLEFIYRGAKDLGENGLIVSFELSPQKLLRDARGFGWDLEPLQSEGKVKVIHTTPAVILQELHAADGVLSEQIRSGNIQRILIDGLTPLKIFGELVNGRPFRDSLQLLVDTLQRYGITAMLTREIPEGPAESHGELSHEQFVCDTIITLSQTTNARNVHRFIEIKKSRGQDFISGQHTLRIEKNHGVRIYRRTQSRPKAQMLQPTSTRTISSGIPSLNQIMGGGVFQGSVTLIVGISGTGKTVMGTQFLAEGAKRGEKGLLVSLDEYPAQMIRNADSLGLDFGKEVEAGNITLYYDSPLELELDVHFERVVDLIEKNGIQRVVIDSLAAYESASPGEAHQFIYALTSYLKSKLITPYVNYESPELLGLSQISEDFKVSAIVDNIVLLNYVEISTQLRRAITVPKARGKSIPQKTREFVIEHGGIRLLDETRGEAAQIEDVPQLPFSSYYGLLSRAPARHSPIIEERIASGEELPKSPKLKRT